MSVKIEGQFLPFPQDLLESSAWWEALQHRYVMSLLNFLIHEHLHHGGKENAISLPPINSFGATAKTAAAFGPELPSLRST